MCVNISLRAHNVKSGHMFIITTVEHQYTYLGHSWAEQPRLRLLGLEDANTPCALLPGVHKTTPAGCSPHIPSYASKDGARQD